MLFRSPNDFGYLVQGLMVFGYQAVEPAYVGTAVITAG